MNKSQEKAFLRAHVLSRVLLGDKKVEIIPVVELPDHVSSERKIDPEQEESNPLVPRNFDEYIGQKEVKEVVQIIVDSALIKGQPLPNIMLFGPYGLGKTTLSKLIMRRYGTKYRFIDGSSVNKTFDFSGYYIIDEIHNINSTTADYMNTLLDRNELHIVGCSTNPGLLPTPFRSRFRLLHLQPYTEGDIQKILKSASKRSKLSYSTKAIQVLARRSKLNPRISLNSLLFASEIMTVKKDTAINIKLVEEALTKLGIDEDGLTRTDLAYLALLSHKPMGLQQICVRLGLSAETVENEIEPYLLQTNRVVRTSKGRVLPEDNSLEQDLINSLTILKHKKSLGDSMT